MQFGKLESINLREVWKKEAYEFTPWLAENLSALGEALGMELELERREADVGDFSLDILAKDLGMDGYVVIENQICPTDHGHLGKLITYAAGYDASAIIWIAESIREEHRQALEWLNQHSDKKTNFFAVVVEVFKIDDSKPVFKFRPIVFPNEWQKVKRQQANTDASPRAEAYRGFFQELIDELREKHHFTNARLGQPQNWYSFSSGIPGFVYSACFAQGERFRTEIYIDKGDTDQNKEIFDELLKMKKTIETEVGSELSWERLDERRASRIAVYREGSIEKKDQHKEYQKWMVENLLKFKKVFNEKIAQILKE
jgi:hypothetical protein